MTLDKDALMQINSVIYPRLIKELKKMPNQRMRVGMAETLLQYAIGALIYENEYDLGENAEAFKKELKLMIQLCMMRTIALIDAYPNSEDAEGFRAKSHTEYRKWLHNEHGVKDNTT
jgi:hypothetical protein